MKIQMNIPGWVMKYAAKYADKGKTNKDGSDHGHNYIYLHSTPEGNVRIVATNGHRLFLWEKPWALTGVGITARQFQYLIRPVDTKRIRKGDKSAWVAVHQDKGTACEIRVFSAKGKLAHRSEAITPADSGINFGRYDWVIPEVNNRDFFWQFKHREVAWAFEMLAPFSSKGEVRVNFFANGLASDTEGPTLQAWNHGANREAAVWGYGSCFNTDLAQANYQPRSGRLSGLSIFRLAFNGKLLADTLEMDLHGETRLFPSESAEKACVIKSIIYPEVTRVIMPVMLSD